MSFKTGDIVRLRRKDNQTGAYAVIDYHTDYYVGDVDLRGYLDLRSMINKNVSLSQDRLKHVYYFDDFEFVKSTVVTAPVIETGQVWRNSYGGEEVIICYINDKQVAFEDCETKELDADTKTSFLEDFELIEKLSQWINVVRDVKGNISLYNDFDKHDTKESAIEHFHRHSEGNYTLIDTILVEWRGKIGD